MFKYSSIKKYGKKLHPALKKRYGDKNFYNASQIRSTIYQCDFNPKYLPLGYLLFLENSSLLQVINQEFPQLCMTKYKKELCEYLIGREHHGYLQVLSQS